MIRRILSAIGLGKGQVQLKTRADAGIATSRISREAVELSGPDWALEDAKRIVDAAGALDLKMALASSFEAVKPEVEQEIHRLDGELQSLRNRVQTASRGAPK